MITPTLAESDLRPFSDPATAFELDEGHRDIRIKLVRDGRQLEYMINRETGELNARHDHDRAYSSLTSLIASSDFANIRQLAATQRRMYQSYMDTPWIEAEGRLVDTLHDGERISGEALIRRLLGSGGLTTSDPELRLSILVIDGPAGIGKTTLIQRSAAQRAAAYERHNSNPPLLHVTSRGRRLTNLSDALAQATQSLRAKFTYDQIPVLVRRNLIQIAIDGFDELVDADGYKDAWFALQAFFEDVGHGGPILLAGRNTFFDQQGFLNRLMRVRDRIDLVQLHLADVSVDAARDYLRAYGWSDETLDDAASPLRSDEYIRRPFFLTSIAEFGSWDAFEPPNETVRGFLVNRLVEREANLTVEKVALDRSTVETRLFDIFSETALEMLDNESDNADVELVAFLTELTFGSDVDSRDLAKLSSKAGSFAPFEPDERPGRVRFRHSEVLNYFASIGLISRIASDDIPRFIRRGVVGGDLQETFADVFLTIDAGLAQAFVSALLECIRRFSDETFSGNLVALLFASASRSEGHERIADSALINELRLPNVAIDSRLSDSTINVLDVRGSDVSKVRFENCVASRVVADKRAVFGFAVPTVHALQLQDNGESRLLYDRDAIDEWIQRSVMPEAHDRGTQYPYNAVGELLVKIARRARRQYYLKESEDDPGGLLMKDQNWPDLKTILDSEKRLKYRQDVSAKGPRAVYVHVVDTASLLDPEASLSSRRIWEAVRALRPTK
jgi:hypothetical protein